MMQGFAHHLGQRLRVRAIRSLALRRDRARRGVERDQHARLRLDQRETAGERWAGLGEWIRPRRVEDDDARLELQRGQRPDVVGEPYRFGRYVGIARDLPIDRNEVVFALELNAVAADIDERDGVRPRACGLL